MYYREPRIPSETDLQLIEGAGHIAVIAIEGERSQAASTRSEAELRTIIDAIPQLIVSLGADGQFLYANQAILSVIFFKALQRVAQANADKNDGDRIFMDHLCNGYLQHTKPFIYGPFSDDAKLTFF